MELIKLKSIRISVTHYIFILFLFNSCQKRMEQGKLECILESIEVDKEGMNILVGQHDGWTDSTVLIVIVFADKSMNTPYNSSLKGKYKDLHFASLKRDYLN